MNRLARAGFWMLDYGYSVRSEVSGAVRGRRTVAVRAEGAAAAPVQVVLVPGVYERWHFMLPIARRLARLGHPVHLLPELGRNLLPIADSARIVAARLAADDLRNVVIVAHSKGGLIGKYLMLRLDPEHRVTRMVAINSPFSGSSWARYLRLRSIRMFAADDLTVTFLGAPSPVNERITSVFGTYDQNVQPGSGSAPARRRFSADLSASRRLPAGVPARRR
ncbi:alpha/beta hydrolase [Subtercola sp. Z020]|nr:alpha/beta hydrolase [Subtercola sp. Z020]